jgi:hypothetical protein
MISYEDASYAWRAWHKWLEQGALEHLLRKWTRDLEATWCVTQGKGLGGFAHCNFWSFW